MGSDWFADPAFVVLEINVSATIFILPVAIAPGTEHFGDIMSISAVTKKDYLKESGIPNTMLCDDLSTTVADLLGGPPNTTYSQMTDAVALTRAFNPAIKTWVAIFAIALSFWGN